MCPHIQCDHSRPPPSWHGGPSPRSCQESESGTGSSSFLACHQSLSKGSPPSQPPSGKAEKTSSQDLSGGQHAYPHLTPERLPRRELLLDQAGLPASSPTGWCLESRLRRGRWASSSCPPPPPTPRRVKEAMSSHEKPLGSSPSSPCNEQMPHRFGASFANDFNVYLSTPRR